MGTSPTLVWIRRDLRLSDHAALVAAAQTGGPVIAVFIRDAKIDALGAAAKWRFGLGIAHFAKTLEDMGSRLILRSGDPLVVLRDLAAQTGAKAVHWQRAYDPHSVARDTLVKQGLQDTGLAVQSHAGHLLFEPWDVQTKTGGYYRVYSPMWRAVQGRDVPAPLRAPSALPAPEVWPRSEALDDWHMGKDMQRGASICLPHQRIGEGAAQARLAVFIAEKVAAYKEERDFPAKDATSTLSENLTYGEISPAQCWHAGQIARETGAQGAEHFLKELVWREFAYHLMWHSPEILDGCWKPAWEAFPWQDDPAHPHVVDWTQGRTGVRFVDAAMREMYVTGKMHNRARMIVGSYLTKHLMSDWRIGRAWFAECLTDWDEASNAMGWQWIAGCGPDATPYFRVFNPETQLEKFDRDGGYSQRWIAEGLGAPHPDGLSYFEAVPKAWGLSAQAPYPAPIVTAAQGRQAALAAYENKSF